MKVKIKKESDKLYTVITVLMLLVFWFHYFFLTITIIKGLDVGNEIAKKTVSKGPTKEVK